MDEKKLWMKISGSINYYLRYYDREKCQMKNYWKITVEYDFRR